MLQVAAMSELIEINEIADIYAGKEDKH